MRTIAELSKRDHSAQLLLSHDLAVYLGVFGTWQDFKSNEVGVDFTFVHSDVMPALEAVDLEPSEVVAMLERNPADLFAISSAAASG